MLHPANLARIPSSFSSINYMFGWHWCQKFTVWDISITRVASWRPDHREWLLSEVRCGIWTPYVPVLIKISADKWPLNQLTVKHLFFSLIIKTFWHLHHHIVHDKPINLSVWIKEICTLLMKLHIIFSRMQRVNQHARPSIIQVGCPTCCYQVCALDHANVDTADLDYSSRPYHHNVIPYGTDFKTNHQPINM